MRCLVACHGIAREHYKCLSADILHDGFVINFTNCNPCKLSTMTVYNLFNNRLL
jgi:hypothetical protein